jgi:alanyl-tRNA synthetase
MGVMTGDGRGGDAPLCGSTGEGEHEEMTNSNGTRGVHALAVSVLALTTITTVGAQGDGVKQIELLIKKATAAVKAVDDTKLQIQKTMDAYNLVVAPETTNRKSAFGKLQKEMDATKKKQAAIGVRGGEASAEADILFKGWQASTSAISDAGLRAKSEQRLAASQARVAEIQADNRRADELYATFMKALEDQVTFLGHDLNASAVESLKPESAKLNTQASELYAAIEKATSSATAAIAALSPE